MASLTYGSTPGGGFQANVPGAESFGLGDGGGGFGWITDLAKRSAENKLRQQALQLEMMKRQYQNPGQLGAAPREVTQPKPDFGPTPESLGMTQTMNSQGQMGGWLDPSKIPAGLQDKIRGGFYAGGPSNFTYGMIPNQFGDMEQTGRGGGGGTSFHAPTEGEDRQSAAQADYAEQMAQAARASRMYPGSIR